LGSRGIVVAFEWDGAIFSLMKSKSKNSSKRALQDAELRVVRVMRLRVKDKHAALLKDQGKEVNFVWNYTQNLGLKVLEREGRFVSAFEVAAYTFLG
jgi:hypothetical protein